MGWGRPPFAGGRLLKNFQFHVVKRHFTAKPKVQFNRDYLPSPERPNTAPNDDFVGENGSFVVDTLAHLVLSAFGGGDLVIVGRGMRKK